MPDEFALEPSTPPGEIPERVIAELRECRRRATDFAESFSEAIKTQAERFGVPASALRRYVVALEADTTDKLADEASALERLLGVE